MTARWMAEDPSKRWTETFVLCYSPFWIGIVVVIMATRAVAGWGDLGHLVLGVGLAVPLWVAPILTPSAGDRGRPFHERHAVRFQLWIGLFTLLQVYFGSALFFDVLGMEYHFPVRWIVNRTPLFLYFMTVAYFSTYYVAMSLVWRRFTTGFPSAPWIVRLFVLCVLGYAVAFCETAGMANEWMRAFFLYRDRSLVLRWGSACYGTIFVLSLPFVFRLSEDPSAKRSGLARLVGEVLAVNMAALIAYEAWAHLLGPA
jgi:cycloeucalenol cycloisomerase